MGKRRKKKKKKKRRVNARYCAPDAGFTSTNSNKALLINTEENKILNFILKTDFQCLKNKTNKIKQQQQQQQQKGGFRFHTNSRSVCLAGEGVGWGVFDR